MSAPTLNKELFKRNLRKLYDLWENDSNGLASLSSLFVLLGRDANAKPYSKSYAFQIWLYSCELEDTLAVATKDKFVILASGKKANFFESVVGEGSDGLPAIEVIQRNKADKDKENFTRLTETIGDEIGCFIKDKYKNEFVDSWESALTEKGVKKVDMSASFMKLWAIKEGNEISLIKNASNVSVNSWSNIKKMFVDLIDKETTKKMSDLSKRVDDSMNDAKVQGDLIRKRNVESCYDTILQSGGSYNFKWSTATSDSRIHWGAITVSLGAKFENYCSNLGRTLLVQPSKQLEDAYESVLAAELKLIESLKPGVKLKDAYAAAVSTLKPDLRANLYKKELGFLTGIEFREGNFAITADSEAVVKAGMVFVVSIGVGPIGEADAGKKAAAVLLSDTIQVTEEGPNVVLTEKAKSRLKSNMVRINENAEEEEEEDDKSRKTRSARSENEEMGRGKRSVLLNQTRNKITNEEKRNEHQRMLAEQLNENARLRLTAKSGNDEQKKIKKSNVSYKSLEKFPTDSDVRKLSVYVDKKHDSVILPIFGVPVPFHISMIKNCSQSVEGEYTYLRVNFTHPGSQVKENTQFPNPLAEYVKELTFRSSNVKEPGEISATGNDLATAFRLIKDMQKKFRTEELEQKEKEGTVKQDKLILSLGKANPKMKDLFVRPNIMGKKISGSLEAHTNGFRYSSLRGDKIDVLYNNIKHAFYQPCDNEMLILLHFHLKNPVLWGKKKYEDVQFYAEVGEASTDLGKYHHMQDRDDIQSEQMEREMRRRLNEVFKSFISKVEKQTNEKIDFDSPFNELAFMGTPGQIRSNCSLKPTSSCLVSLTEWPTFIVTLEEVELVHLERVSFSHKNFDMVFIFKDYNRKTEMVSCIPMTSIESIREWLNSCDIRYTSGVATLKWDKVLKHITDDLDQFFEEGGWNFLDGDAAGSGEEDDDSDEEDEPYEEGADSEGDSSEDDSGSEGSAVMTDEEDDSDGSGDDDLSSDEESGKDWDELEREAARDDKRREREEMERGSGDRKRRDHGRGGPSAKRRR